MTRKKKRKQENVLESVFGIRLNSGDGGTTPPEPDNAPDPDAVEERADALAADRERIADLAEIRVAAIDAARAAGIKPQRAVSFVKILDFSGVAVDSEGEPDTTEIERIVRAGSKEYPEFRTRAQYERLYGGR
jgi:hypothetical protein